MDEGKKDHLGSMVSISVLAIGFALIISLMVSDIKDDRYKSYLEYKAWFEEADAENKSLKNQNEKLITENESLTIKLNEITDKYNNLVRDYNNIVIIKLESEE